MAVGIMRLAYMHQAKESGDCPLPQAQDQPRAPDAGQRPFLWPSPSGWPPWLARCGGQRTWLPSPTRPFMRPMAQAEIGLAWSR